MKKLSPKYIYLPFIPTDKTAVTIYPFIFGLKRKQAGIKKILLFMKYTIGTNKIIGKQESFWIIAVAAEIYFALVFCLI